MHDELAAGGVADVDRPLLLDDLAGQQDLPHRFDRLERLGQRLGERHAQRAGADEQPGCPVLGDQHEVGSADDGGERRHRLEGAGEQGDLGLGERRPRRGLLVGGRCTHARTLPPGRRGRVARAARRATMRPVTGAELQAGPGEALALDDVLGAFEAVPEAVLLLDDQWRIVHVNAAGEQQLLRPAAELVGNVVWELYPQTLDHPTYGAAHEVARTGAPAEIVWRLPGGQEWFEQRITRSGRLVAIASREVTAARDDVERRRRLSRISEALASAETPEQVCVVITDLALPLAGASSGGVIAQDDPGWIRSLRWVGIDVATATEFARYPLTTLAPGAEAMRERELVWGGDEVIAQRWPAIAPALERAGARSVAGVPMVVRGEALGALVLQFTAATPPDAGTTDFMRTVAAVCAQALHRTQRLAAEHEAALLLQRSLLPQVPDRLDRVTLDARYRPGDPGVEVGGDWYDVVPLGGGQLLLVVADVQGHDLIAATVMGQLRSVTRALALEGLAPGALLARLEKFLGQVTTDRIVTALVVLVDAAARFVVAASAGHLAPLVLAPPGTPGGPCAASPLAVEPGPPLGVGETAVWPETTTTLAPGATVLAFTDGLVETRRRDVEDAVTALAATLAEPPAPVTPAELVGRALEFLPPGERGDDVAVLAVRIDADDALAPRLPAARSRRRRSPSRWHGGGSWPCSTPGGSEGPRRPRGHRWCSRSWSATPCGTPGPASAWCSACWRRPRVGARARHRRRRRQPPAAGVPRLARRRRRVGPGPAAGLAARRPGAGRAARRRRQDGARPAAGLRIRWVLLAGRQRRPAGEAGDRQRVPVDAEADDDAGRDRRHVRVVPERLARVHVRHVHLGHREPGAADRVAQRHGRVRVGAGVEDGADDLDRPRTRGPPPAASRRAGPRGWSAGRRRPGPTAGPRPGRAPGRRRAWPRRRRRARASRAG